MVSDLLLTMVARLRQRSRRLFSGTDKGGGVALHGREGDRDDPLASFAFQFNPGPLQFRDQLSALTARFLIHEGSPFGFGGHGRLPCPC